MNFSDGELPEERVCPEIVQPDVSQAVTAALRSRSDGSKWEEFHTPMLFWRPDSDFWPQEEGEKNTSYFLVSGLLQYSLPRAQLPEQRSLRTLTFLSILEPSHFSLPFLIGYQYPELCFGHASPTTWVGLWFCPTLSRMSSPRNVLLKLFRNDLQMCLEKFMFQRKPWPWKSGNSPTLSVCVVLEICLNISEKE